MGIIDTLTEFGGKKKGEYTLRAIFQNSKTVSCVPPTYYGDRFYKFMNENVFVEKQKTDSEKRSRSIQE